MEKIKREITHLAAFSASRHIDLVVVKVGGDEVRVGDESEESHGNFGLGYIRAHGGCAVFPVC